MEWRPIESAPKDGKLVLTVRATHWMPLPDPPEEP
ncbi:MAG: DUF551 domain-containing protein [Geminicoccaceae bacterium]